MINAHRYPEDELDELLREYVRAKEATLGAEGAARAEAQERLGAAERRALGWIYGYLHERLKPQIRRAVPHSAHEGELRFTELFNEVFLTVLERQPDSFWRSDCKDALAGWVSLAIKRDVIDRLKHLRVQRREGVANDAADELEYVGELAASREDHFHSKHQLDLVDAFRLLDEWRTEHPRYEAVVRYRYIDGLTYAEIGALMQTTRERAKLWHDEAIAKLKRAFGTGGEDVLRT